MVDQSNETPDDKPVPALDEVGEGPALEDADGNEMDVEDNDNFPMVGDPVKVNEWGDEIGDEL